MILKDIIQRSKLENLMHIFEFKGCQGFYAKNKTNCTNKNNPSLHCLEDSLKKLNFAVFMKK